MNPIALIVREMRIRGRSWRTYAGRAGVAAAACIVIGLIILSVSEASLDEAGRFASAMRLQTAAPIVAAAVLWMELVFMTFLPASILGSWAADERRAQTLPSLLTTPMSGGAIVLGVFTGRMVEPLLIALVPLPALLALQVLGGVDAEIVTAGMLAALARGILSGALATYFAIGAGKARSASGSAIGIIIFLEVGLAMTRRSMMAWRGGEVELIDSLSSFRFMSAASDRLIDPAGFDSSSVLVLGAVNAGFSLLLAAGFLSLASASFRSRAMRSLEPKAARRWLTPRARRAAAATAGAGAVIDRPSRTLRDPVLFWLEARRPLYSRARAIMLVLVCAALLGAAAAFTGMNEPALHGTLILVSLLLMAAIAASAGAGAIAPEREGGTWDALLTAPLSPRSLLVQKILGAAARTWLPPAAVLIWFGAVAAPSGAVSIAIIAPLALLFVSVILTMAALGVLSSLLTRRQATAGAMALGLGVLLYVGLPTFAALFEVFSVGADEDFGVLEVISENHPWVISVQALEAATTRYPDPAYGTFLGVIGHSAICLAVHVLIAAAALGYATLRFNARTGRSS